MTTREHNLKIARLLSANYYSIHIGNGTGTRLLSEKRETDFSLVAGLYGVTVAAVRQALKRKNEYPHSKLVRAYDKIQQAKKDTIYKLSIQ